MRSHSALYVLAAAFVAFAIWELVQHAFLRELPPGIYHVLGLVIEFGLVIALALVIWGPIRQQENAHRRLRTVHDTVVDVLAQDLRPPLVSLTSRLRLLEQSAPEGIDGETRDLVRQVEARAGVLLGMIDDLVAVARQTGDVPAGCGLLTSAEMARHVLESHRPLAQARGVELIDDISGGVTASCGEPGHVMQALSSLVGDAIRGTPADGKVRLSLREEDGAVSFSVADEAPSVLDHAAALPEAAARSGRIGLRYCQSVADALGGSARYEPLHPGNLYAISLPTRHNTQ